MNEWWTVAAFVALLAIVRELNKQFGWDKDATILSTGPIGWGCGLCRFMLRFIPSQSHSACPMLFSLRLALLFFSASFLLFSAFFWAKILGASLSFWIDRTSRSAMKWAQGNKYFHVLSREVERDGWLFVLLACFSPMPFYVIKYALAVTKVGFILDFLVPTVIGCLPMILQNTFIGSLAGSAVS